MSKVLGVPGPLAPNRPGVYVKPRLYSGEEWDGVRPVFEELYLGKGKKLDEVVEFMKIEHNFHANPKMYKYRIKVWGLSKYRKATGQKQAIPAGIRKRRHIRTHQPAKDLQNARIEARRQISKASGLQISAQDYLRRIAAKPELAIYSTLANTISLTERLCHAGTRASTLFPTDRITVAILIQEGSNLSSTCHTTGLFRHAKKLHGMKALTSIPDVFSQQRLARAVRKDIEQNTLHIGDLLNFFGSNSLKFMGDDVENIFHSLHRLVVCHCGPEHPYSVITGNLHLLIKSTDDLIAVLSATYDHIGAMDCLGNAWARYKVCRALGHAYTRHCRNSEAMALYKEYCQGLEDLGVPETLEMHVDILLALSSVQQSSGLGQEAQTTRTDVYSRADELSTANLTLNVMQACGFYCWKVDHDTVRAESWFRRGLEAATSGQICCREEVDVIKLVWTAMEMFEEVEQVGRGTRVHQFIQDFPPSFMSFLRHTDQNSRWLRWIDESKCLQSGFSTLTFVSNSPCAGVPGLTP